MTQVLSSPYRNVEYIRRQNLEDNQLFLEKLRLKYIREDFVTSARSILRKDDNNQTRKYIHRSYERIERNTRYNEKLKAGQILPFISERQRRLEEKKKEALEKERKRLAFEQKKEEILFEKELRKIERELLREERTHNDRIKRRRRRSKPSKWTIFERTHPNRYQQLFLPRHTKVGERAEQNF